MIGEVETKSAQNILEAEISKIGSRLGEYNSLLETLEERLGGLLLDKEEDIEEGIGDKSELEKSEIMRDLSAKTRKINALNSRLSYIIDRINL